MRSPVLDELLEALGAHRAVVWATRPSTGESTVHQEEDKWEEMQIQE